MRKYEMYQIYILRKVECLRYAYTDEDIIFLQQYYPDGKWDNIMNRFPNLSKSCIYKKCLRLGIKSNNKHREDFNNSINRRKWKEQELSIIKENYSLIPLDDLCCLLPNRTKNMILSQARRLGLISYQKLNQTWKQSEIQYIIDNWRLTPDKIMAEKLGRTFRSIKYKREELGLYRQNFEDKSYPSLSKYLRGQNQEWKKNSLVSCNFQCILTGSKNFEIHHLYGVSNIINDVLNKYPQYKDFSFSEYSHNDLLFLTNKFFEEQNKYPLGVCIEKKLHILFHSMYGQYYNTPEQWYQFCNDYKIGIYNKYI